MTEMDDMDLIREYADRDSEAAFADLVRRRINFVYSIAFRWVGNSADAQDVTQAVFIILAKKAASLRQRTNLTGWLYETTRLTAATLLRTKTRQQAREQEAYRQSTMNDSDSDGVWQQLAPMLEEAMGRLSEKERALLALRLFDNKTAAETAALLGIQEGAAHKRTARAMDKLRHFFLNRGIDSTAAIIAGAISANSVQAAPVGLAATISTTAVKGAAAGASTLTLVKGALKLMAWTKTQTVIVGAVVAGLAAFSVVQHQAQVKLRGQNEALQQAMAQLQTENERLSIKPAQTPHLPAPQMQMAAAAAPAPAEDSPSLNFYARLKNKPTKLTHEQIEAYLKGTVRSAANLLAAFRTSGDAALLQEAKQNFPNDPRVDFEAVLDKNLSPDEQRQWLNAFEKSAPDNALANYLSALNYFNYGQIDQGVQELSAASGKQFTDYTLSRYQDDEEAYLAAGYSQADAEAIASMQETLPQLSQLKQLGRDTVDLANAYTQAGDTASAQAALQMAANLGRSYANSTTGEPAISQLVGMAVETMALNAMDPNSPFGGNGQTVQDQLNQLAQQKTAIQQLFQQADPLRQTMSDQDWIIYTNRRMLFGEVAAAQWVVSKYGQQ